MTATATPFEAASAPSTNGIFTIGRKGRIQVRLTDETPAVTIDVIATINEYDAYMEPLFDAAPDPKPGEQRRLTNAQMVEYDKMQIQFVEAKLGASGLTAAESRKFVNWLREQGDGLKDFFSMKRAGDVSSSPGSIPDSPDEY